MNKKELTLGAPNISIRHCREGGNPGTPSFHYTYQQKNTQVEVLLECLQTLTPVLGPRLRGDDEVESKYPYSRIRWDDERTGEEVKL